MRHVKAVPLLPEREQRNVLSGGEGAIGFSIRALLCRRDFLVCDVQGRSLCIEAPHGVYDGRTEQNEHVEIYVQKSTQLSARLQYELVSRRVRRGFQ